MATWYVDTNAGTDSNASAGNGDSFATRRKKVSNIVAAALAPGDFIRIMKSPDATSLGITGVWTSGGLASTVVPTSSTNATPIVVTKAGHGLATNDTIIMRGHTTNTNANGVWKVTVSGDTFTLLNANGTNSVGNGVGGASGTFRKITNSVVILASSLVANIACHGNSGAASAANWTASANVTCTLNTTDYKEGATSQSIAIAAGFTTGLAAYFATGTLNLSGYKQLSFWIKQTSGTVGAAGACTLALCSDTAGVTAVNTFNIPALGALNYWVVCTVDLAVALGSSIQSIAFNVVTDNGAQTFLIDNIIACKDSTSADSLTLSSLISKNTGSEGWYGIQSINSTSVILDGMTSIIPGATPARGYIGTTETVTTYKREAIKADINTTVVDPKDSGTEGSLIAISGGWNTTDMSTQTGDTYFDGQLGLGIGVSVSGLTYVSFDKISCFRFNQGFSFSSTRDVVATIANANNNSNSGVTIIGATACDNTITVINTNGNNNGVQLVDCYNNSVAITNANSNANYGLNITTCNTNYIAIANTNNNPIGIYLLSCYNNFATIASISDNATSAINAGNSVLYLLNSTLNSSVEVTYHKNYSGAIVWSHQEDGIANNHFGYTDGGLISSDTTTRHTASGIAWKLAPTSSTIRYSGNPLAMSIAKIACAANTLVTVSLWMRRTDTGLTARLRCKGGQIAGVSADVSTSMTAAADTYEQVSISFTPTEAGVVEILAECWGGTTYSLYVDDFAVA